MNPPFPRSLYRQYFTPEECALLDATPCDDLSSEINVLRVLIARLLEACHHARELSLEIHAKVLSAFSAAGIVMARLVRLQCQLHHPSDALWAEIAQGEELARQRRGVYSYLSSRT